MTKVWIYRIAIAWALLYVCGSVISSTIAGIVNVDWVKLNTQARIILVLTILGNVINTLSAFLSQAAKKLEDGKLPINGNGDIRSPSDTVHLTKTDISVETTGKKE